MRKLIGMAIGLMLVSGLVLSVACSNDDDVVQSPVLTAGPEGWDGEMNRVGAGTDFVAVEAGAVEETSGKTWATDRMIVRTGNLDLKVANVPDALKAVEGVAEALGGYVVSSNWNGSEGASSASIAIRVPAETYDSAMESLRELAMEVLHEDTQTKDVTEEYTDLGSQLRNLEATESRYLALLEKAQTIDEILKVEQMVSKTRGEIETTKGRMQYLEETSVTSLIQLKLIEEGTLLVDFVANRIEIEQGDEIAFTNRTVGGAAPYGYRWDFGDGDGSTDQNPRPHEYDRPGEYTVSLTVSDANGNTLNETKDAYITVIAKPGWSAGSVAGGAWTGLINIAHVLGHLGIWIGVLSVIWLPVLAGFVAFRRYRRKAA